MRLAWLTDIHLDHLRAEAVQALWQDVARSSCDAIVLTGDIAIAATIEDELRRAAAATRRPIYFVLGNHDFYGSSIADVRRRMAALCRESPSLTWMTGSSVVTLDERTALVGHDAWADARLGDPVGSPIRLSDWLMIDELAVPTEERIARLRALGDEAAAHLRQHLATALERHERVVVLMHPPPIREACRYYSFVSPDVWLPHLACAAAGEVLLELAARRPDRSVLVLAGHTHGRARERPLPNLEIRVGAAEYGKPTMQPMVELP